MMKLILFFCLLIAFYIVQINSQDLFDISIDHIIYLRGHSGPYQKYLDKFFLLYSELGDKYGVCVLIMFAYNTLSLSKSAICMFTLGII